MGFSRRGIGLACVLIMSVSALDAESASDSDRLEKLEEAVQLLQKSNADLQHSNAELKAEVSRLKKHESSSESKAKATKADVAATKKPSSGQAPPIEAGSSDRLKLSTPITELEIFGDIRLRYEYRAAQTDETSDTSGADRLREPPDVTIGSSAKENAIAFDSDCEARCWTIGSLESGWRPARIHGRQT